MATSLSQGGTAVGALDPDDIAALRARNAAVTSEANRNSSPRKDGPTIRGLTKDAHLTMTEKIAREGEKAADAVEAALTQAELDSTSRVQRLEILRNSVQELIDKTVAEGQRR